MYLKRLLVIGLVVIPNKVIAEQIDLFSLSLSELMKVSFRESIRDARDIRRDSVNAQSTILAEDIAEFPELNVAEAIQRMPGVSITREGGEGRQISLRGVGPQYTQVQLNGMETLAVSSSPMDSRNTLDYDRAFDFNVFSSELFNRIDINKSYSAELDEGGIGGAVMLHTPKPFSTGSSRLAINLAAGKNSYTQDSSPRISLLASEVRGDFGALMTLVFSQRDTVEKGFNTTRWRAAVGGPQADDSTTRNRYNQEMITDPEEVAVIESGDLWFSRSNRYSVWENSQRRIGLNLALQYKLSTEAQVGLTYVHSQLENEREEFHLGTGRSSSRWPGVLEDLQYQQAKDGETELIYARYSQAQLRSEHRVDEADSFYDQLVVDGDWQLNAQLSAKAMLGWSKNKFEQPELDKVYLISEPGEITTDFRQDRFYGQIDYDIDTKDPNLWSTYDLYLFEKYVDDSFVNAKLDFSYQLKGDNKLYFGASSKRYQHKMSEGDSSPDFTDSDSNSFAYLYKGSDDVDWVVADVEAAHQLYSVNSDVEPGPQNNQVEETSWSAYGDYQWRTQLHGWPLSASFGLRYLNTKVELNNIVQSEPVLIKGDYQHWLPTFNSKIEFSSDLIGRLSLSKNISRPYLAEQRIALKIDNSARTLWLNGDTQPLTPYESVNFESSLEYYFSEVGFVELGLFWKEITGFTTEITSRVPYGTTGLPLSLLGPDQDAETIYSFTRLESSEDATIRGAELSFQRDFDFLPSPFNRLGVISNLTLVDGEATYRDVQASGQNQSKSFPGLSKWSGNFTLYYEAQDWGARLSGAYRDEYISNVEPGLADEDERGFHATFYVDMSAYYKVNERFKVSLEAINLTNEREEQYSDSNNRAYNTNTSGTSVYLGLSIKL